ncbi:MAG: anaerobic carbon-monoxide dehydrogenase catalytic subunit [Actinomycetota bacterium]|nr:anaerobic carbon-monoxide dehydrogenase catalytic subunit [Actinomycetota bacterium]
MQLEEKVNVSVHESVNAMYEKVSAEGVTNIFDRYKAQGPRCNHCVQGLSCQLCSMGPCRITPKNPYGACGIDANAMAMRNMLHRAVMGIAAYSYHANEVAKTLKATAEGKTPFKIRDVEKLKAFAAKLGIGLDQNINELAIKVADAMLEELNRDSSEPSKMVEVFAPESRKKLWRKLGIFPGGPLHESMVASVSAMTNVDGDYTSLALKALRLGIASAYGALVPLEIGQDILFGTPMPHRVNVDFGVIEKDYVNILPNGHEPFIGTAILEVARRPESQAMAKEAGAKGIHVIGSIETGQEMIQRYEIDDVFVGFTGNWLNQEFVLATGAIDLLAVDMNCSLATLGQLAEKYSSTVVPVSKLVAIPGTSKRIDYRPEDTLAQAEKLVKIAIENFKRRKDKEAFIPSNKKEVVAGISPEAILSVLGGSLEPLIEAIKNRAIKGIVALVSCTTLKNGPQDALSVAVAKELIKRDVLVLSAGCGNAAMQVGGLTAIDAIEQAGDGLKAICKLLGVPPVLSFGTCTDTGRLANLVTEVANALNVDPSELPIAVTAPEYMEQKAVIDAFFAVAYGLYTHVSPTPPVTGAPDLVALLTDGVEAITGGKVAVGDDPMSIVDGIEAHINKRREALGI